MANINCLLLKSVLDEMALLKGDLPTYFKELVTAPENNSQQLLGDDFQHQNLQRGDFIYWNLTFTRMPSNLVGKDHTRYYRLTLVLLNSKVLTLEFTSLILKRHSHLHLIYPTEYPSLLEISNEKYPDQPQTNMDEKQTISSTDSFPKI